MFSDFFNKILGTNVAAKQAWKRRSSSVVGDLQSTAEGRHPSWFEACFDLIIVASFTALSEGLKANLNDESIWVRFTAPVIYYFQFAPIFFSWSVVDLYINRFDLDGILGGFTIFSHALVIGFMNVALLNLNEAESKEQRMNSLYAYAMCNMFSNLVSFAMYLRVFLQTKIKNMSLSFMISHGGIAVMWILLSFFTHNDYIMYPIWALILLACHYRINMLIWIAQNIGTPYFGFVNNTPPIDIPLITERIGLLVVIGIGESLMATVEGIKYVDGGNHWNVLFACTHAFLLKVAYFDVFDSIGEEVERHAMKKKDTGISFIVNHIFCVMAVTLSSQMMKDSHEYYNEDGGAEGIPVAARILFASAMSALLFTFFWMSNHHEREEEKQEYYPTAVRWQVMYATIALLYAIAYFIPWKNPYILEFNIQLVFLCFISFEFFCRRYIRHNEYDELEQGEGNKEEEVMHEKANALLSGNSETELVLHPLASGGQDDNYKSAATPDTTTSNNGNDGNVRNSLLSQITSVSKVFGSINDSDGDGDGNGNGNSNGEGRSINGAAVEGYQSIGGSRDDSNSDASWTGGTNSRTDSFVGTPPTAGQQPARRSSSHYGKRSSRGSIHNPIPMSPEDYDHSADHV